LSASAASTVTGMRMAVGVTTMSTFSNRSPIVFRAITMRRWAWM
jgi:hypothetical protein